MIGAVVSLALFGALGLILGVAQFVALARDVRRYVGGKSRAVTAALHLARMLAIVAAWVLIARVGRAPGLLAAFVGFLIARPVVLVRRRAGP